jgi:hypothetical protein
MILRSHGCVYILTKQEKKTYNKEKKKREQNTSQETRHVRSNITTENRNSCKLFIIQLNMSTIDRRILLYNGYCIT